MPPKTFPCLTCDTIVIDGDTGMLELGLCFPCMEEQDLLSPSEDPAGPPREVHTGAPPLGYTG